MKDESENPKKGEGKKYWVSAGLGSGASLLIYAAVKVARGEKLTLTGALLSGLAGGVSTPIAIRTIPNLMQILNQARRDHPLRPAAVPSHQAPVNTSIQQPLRSKIQSIISANPGCQSPSANTSPSRSSAGALSFRPFFYEELEKFKTKLRKTLQNEELAKKDSCSKSEEDPLAQSWLKIIKPSSVTLIVGKRGSGKTSALHKILEYCRHRGPCYLVGFSKEAKRELPDWIGVVPAIGEAPRGSTVALDEAGLLFSSRESMRKRNRELLRDIVLARQRDHTLIVAAQDSSHGDKNILRSIDGLVIKEPAPLQAKMDRPELRTYLEKAQEAFQEIEGDKRSFCYVPFSPSGFSGMIQITKASHWNEKLSRAYALGVDFELKKEAKTFSKEEKMKLAWNLHEEGKSVRDIARELGVSKSTIGNWIQQYEREHAAALRLFLQQFPSLDTKKESAKSP